MSGSSLPDEIGREIFDIGIRACNFTYKDLCCTGITSRRFNRLSGEDEFWSVLLLKDFPFISSANSHLNSNLCTESGSYLLVDVKFGFFFLFMDFFEKKCDQV